MANFFNKKKRAYGLLFNQNKRENSDLEYALSLVT